ncbi:unnamed protein product [Mesocestoides corti]|uniref:C2 domain-containing protein n=1 Tax=Mesocestoides corti TaxID=53468 RepID=A0A0R3UMF4_MESCO|nr:unnamed protein product [Mesocestoides corti]
MNLNFISLPLYQSGTGVYIPALPGSWLPKVCLITRVRSMLLCRAHIRYRHKGSGAGRIEFSTQRSAATSWLVDVNVPCMLVMTTDYPTNGENRAWFSEFKPRKCVNTSSASNWRSLHTFVKVHSIPSLKPDDALGLAFFKPSGGGQMFTDTSSPAAHHSSSHSDTPTNLALINDCLTTCLRDCNQLTWFHFRCLMPCAIVALRYRLNITDDDAVQILCSGFTLSPSCEESTLLPNPLSAYVKPEGQKSATSTRRSLFNRPKNLRSIAEIEKKTLRHLDTLEINYSKKSATQAYYKKAKWWKSFPKETWIKSQVRLKYQ